jgi:hypothetical protein
MKASTVIFALVAPVVLASPLSRRDPPTPPKAAAGLSTQGSIDAMTAGAAGFGPAFLAGDAKGVLDALNGMLGGAATFTPGFFSDLAKASQASQAAQASSAPKSTPSVPSKRDQLDPPPTSAAALGSMIQGATSFAPKWLAGDSKGVADAIAAMTNGAASFTPGFFNDLGKAQGKPPGTQ